MIRWEQDWLVFTRGDKYLKAVRVPWSDRQSNGKSSQFTSAQEDAGEHGAVKAACVGVAQGRVIGGQQMEPVGKQIVRTMREAVLGFAGNDAGVEQMREIPVEGDLAQADNDANPWQGTHLGGEMFGAVAYLLRLGLISGRGAADDGSNPGMAQLEAVIAGDGTGLCSEAKLVQNRVHEVSRAIAGEGPAGTVSSMGARRETENQNTGARIAKAGNGSRPVGLVKISSPFGLPDTATIIAQPGTTLAARDGVVNLLEEGRRYLFAKA